MQRSEFTQQSGDGLRLYAQLWEPDAEVRAVVNLVHGLGEHIGRYTHVASALTAAGFAVLGFDLRGHGKSEGQRGHAPSWDTLMDDIGLFLSEAETRLPGQALFLYGHSLGGNLVLNYVLRRKPRLAGAIVTSPMLRTAFQPPVWKIKLGEALYNLWPSFALSNELDVKGLSHDPKVVEAYVNDPLVHNRISARMAMDMLRNGEWAIAHASELALPLLLMHGANDPVCSPKASEEFAQNAPGDVTLKLWDGHYHETHNEPEKDKVLQAVIEWLTAHLA